MTKKKAALPPVVHEGQVLRALPTPQLKLASIEECRREMARVYRRARYAQMDTSDATRLVYILTQIAKLLELGQLEERISTLEKKHEKS